MICDRNPLQFMEVVNTNYNQERKHAYPQYKTWCHHRVEAGMTQNGQSNQYWHPTLLHVHRPLCQQQTQLIYVSAESLLCYSTLPVPIGCNHPKWTDKPKLKKNSSGIHSFKRTTVKQIYSIVLSLNVIETRNYI